MILKIIILIILLFIFLFNKKTKKSEYYTHWKYLPIHYMNSKKRGFYRVDYVPPIIISKSFGTHYNYPILNQRSFCRKYPKCYPCKDWKFIGPPYCL